MLDTIVKNAKLFEQADQIDFKKLVVDVVREKAQSGPIRILDVGGGQFPFLAPEEIPENAEYVVCDISQRQLDKCPSSYPHKFCFDICGELPGDIGKFDVTFSKMLAEHVESGERLYRNLYDLLNPDGICLNHHPTLFAVPFVINKLVPHAIAKRLVHLVFPTRKRNDSVFPAHYSWCTGLESVELPRRRKIGFSEVGVIHQYKHRYWRPFPIIREVFGLMHKISRGLRLNLFSSFAVYYGVKN